MQGVGVGVYYNSTLCSHTSNLAICTQALLSNHTTLYIILLSEKIISNHYDYFSMIDGRLLQPTRPALSLDSTFVQRAFGSGGPNGHISVAYTEV